MSRFEEDSCSSSKPWTWEEKKRFEVHVANFPDDTPDRWHTMANFFPGRSPLELELRYEKLSFDVREIEAGRVELSWPLPEDTDREHAPSEQDTEPSSSTASTKAETKRKRRPPWTEEEHRRFLIGLERYGKGDWRSISQDVVITKTARQVASHAKNYFIRQATPTKERKRASIHDITSMADTPESQEFSTGTIRTRQLFPSS